MRDAGVTPDPRHRLTPPAGLARSAPRDVRLTGSGRVVMVLAWLLAASAIFAGALLYREASRQSAAIAALRRHGITTTAVIDRVWQKKGDEKPAFAAFHFDAGGTQIQGEARMQLDAWRGLRAGSTVRVRYLPEDPARATLEGARVKRLPLAIAFVVSGLLGLIALLCVLVISQQRSLLSEGRLARAVVTALTKHHGSHGHTHRGIKYEFPLLGGGIATGKSEATKTSAVGGTIFVLYDPDRPSRNQPYPFSLVTPDQL